MKEEKGKKEDWLLDAEVQYTVENVSGRWEVALLFIDTKDPKHILIQKIGDYRSERLAHIYGQNMKRTAEKDYRGTRKVHRDAYDINDN